MQNFVQYAPTEVVFGRGTEHQTGEEVKNGAEAECFWYTAEAAPSAAV